MLIFPLSPLSSEVFIFKLLSLFSFQLEYIYLLMVECFRIAFSCMFEMLHYVLIWRGRGLHFGYLACFIFSSLLFSPHKLCNGFPLDSQYPLSRIILLSCDQVHTGAHADTVALRDVIRKLGEEKRGLGANPAKYKPWLQ